MKSWIAVLALVLCFVLSGSTDAGVGRTCSAAGCGQAGHAAAETGCSRAPARRTVRAVLKWRPVRAAVQRSRIRRGCS